jgi:hypothetical protein
MRSGRLGAAGIVWQDLNMRFICDRENINEYR